MKYDCIIIGSGLGGLLSAALLARSGVKVALFEKHYVLGGYASQFKRKGFNFEVGLHAIDGFDERDLKFRVFDFLKINQKIAWVSLDNMYCLKHGDNEVLLPLGREKSLDYLCKEFPEDADKLLEFYSLLDMFYELTRFDGKYIEKRSYSMVLKKYMVSTCGSVIESFFKNEKLRQLLFGHAYFYHDNPYELSFFYFACGLANYLFGGAKIPKKGSVELIDALATSIKENGSEVFLQSEVQEILLDDKKVQGVLVSHKRSVQESYFADIIIANAPMPHVYEKLLKNEVQHPSCNLQKFSVSTSLSCLYIGLSEKLENPHYSTHFVEADFQTHPKFYADIYKNFSTVKNKEMIHTFNCVDYGQLDLNLCKKGSQVSFLSLDRLKNWSQLSLKEYEFEKEKMKDFYLQKFLHYFPKASNLIVCSEFATPKTFARYTNNDQGALYGFAPTIYQSGFYRPRQEGAIKNLYFASAWTRPGAGFSGVMISAISVSQKILKRHFKKNLMMDES
ncbi:MAG: NAD(P)/FAD-dependent oxidoreductase [Candidatus Cloacimonetes bacterium]|nr:NAD(P)/FAD-dependent oxidoreductase [Candidatus Cloacimonadota bacterium]